MRQAHRPRTCVLDSALGWAVRECGGPEPDQRGAYPDAVYDTLLGHPAFHPGLDAVLSLTDCYAPGSDRPDGPCWAAYQLTALRWPGLSIACPHCGSDADWVGVAGTLYRFRCTGGHRFHQLTGTRLEHVGPSRGLDYWIAMAALLASPVRLRADGGRAGGWVGLREASGYLGLSHEVARQTLMTFGQVCDTSRRLDDPLTALRRLVAAAPAVEPGGRQVPWVSDHWRR
jgi:hypothetical protein